MIPLPTTAVLSASPGFPRATEAPPLPPLPNALRFTLRLCALSRHRAGSLSSRRSHALPAPRFDVPAHHLALPTPRFDVPRIHLALPTPRFDVARRNLALPTPRFDVSTRPFAKPTPRSRGLSRHLALPTPPFEVPTRPFAKATPRFDGPSRHHAQAQKEVQAGHRRRCKRVTRSKTRRS